ncbi:MAG: hypothetical protein HeimC3_32040 [Candidatus Heimdallarchaeota archaeon LC_3]|nr:MAG: hypothetical protein HeimC3_32040 [Candidatus Heimdallarchaeota archaeon LC_3]
MTSLHPYSATDIRKSPINDVQKTSQLRKYSKYYVRELKSPWIEFFSSILIPGIGHWYVGKKSDALLIFLLVDPVIFFIALLLLFNFSPLAIFFIPLNIVIGERAYSHVKRYNWYVLAHNLPPPPDP